MSSSICIWSQDISCMNNSSWIVFPWNCTCGAISLNFSTTIAYEDQGFINALPQASLSTTLVPRMTKAVEGARRCDVCGLYEEVA